MYTFAHTQATTKERQLESAATDLWVDMYYDMNYKRVNIARLVRRYGVCVCVCVCVCV